MSYLISIIYGDNDFFYFEVSSGLVQYEDGRWVTYREPKLRKIRKPFTRYRQGAKKVTRLIEDEMAIYPLPSNAHQVSVLGWRIQRPFSVLGPAKIQKVYANDGYLDYRLPYAKAFFSRDQAEKVKAEGGNMLAFFVPDGSQFCGAGCWIWSVSELLRRADRSLMML